MCQEGGKAPCFGSGGVAEAKTRDENISTRPCRRNNIFLVRKGEMTTRRDVGRYGVKDKSVDRDAGLGRIHSWLAKKGATGEKKEERYMWVWSSPRKKRKIRGLIAENGSGPNKTGGVRSAGNRQPHTATKRGKSGGGVGEKWGLSTTWSNGAVRKGVILKNECPVPRGRGAKV